MLRLMIVDDSAVIRGQLQQLFEAEPDVSLRCCESGEEALAAMAEFDPQVVTLDVNMPGMDGLATLARIMARHPRPVVMISALTESRARITVEALAMGAVDCIPKPHLADASPTARQRMIAKIRNAATAHVAMSSGAAERQALGRRPSEPAATPEDEPGLPEGLVLIGVSTGGPRVLEKILPALPQDFPFPVVVCQHMPQAFTGSFARRMDELTHLRTSEVARPTALRSGHIYIARGDADLQISRRGKTLVAMPRPMSAQYRWHPSVDLMVEGALGSFDPRRIIGVQLTGMGDDGVSAMSTLHARGGRTIAESEASATIYGMPQGLVRAGTASAVLHADEMVSCLLEWVRIRPKEQQAWVC
ncbi:chemotaxis-specific protein-glutamate methyltransferase CheB [Niveibacterium sp. SC-1]|uniref:chemotaxis-specific protein-glutamate methyltransferase CheB n=1 Tax=Niveibacterium sp. SC-1 TaxID=3135646 RepID=UPI00311D5B49